MKEAILELIQKYRDESLEIDRQIAAVDAANEIGQPMSYGTEGLIQRKVSINLTIRDLKGLIEMWERRI